MAQNYGLGRGLSSLIPNKKNPSISQSEKINQPQDDFNYFGGNVLPKDEKSDEGKRLGGDDKKLIREIELEKIVPNPHQPRNFFDEEKLKELAMSIKEHGIIQPIIVSPKGDKFEIVAGERRFQSAKLAGLLRIPAIVRKTEEKEKLELAIVENIQRQNLNPIEEAKSYFKLMEEFDLEQEEIAQKMGKSRSAIANKIRMLNLPLEIQKALAEGKITEGHAKSILAVSGAEKQRALYELILKNKWTVRQTEEKTKEVSVRSHNRKIVIDPETKQLEDELAQALGTKVKIKKSGGGGKILIEYYSQEELGSLLDKIKK